MTEPKETSTNQRSLVICTRYKYGRNYRYDKDFKYFSQRLWLSALGSPALRLAPILPSPPAGTNPPLLPPLPFIRVRDTNRDLKKFCLSSQFYFDWFFSYSEGPSCIPLTLLHSYFLVTNFRVFSLMEKSALFNSLIFSFSIL